MMAISRHLLLLFISITSALLPPARADIILKPSQADKAAIALVLIPSQGVDPAQYRPLAAALQEHCFCSLWVAIPQYTLDIVIYPKIGEGIDRVLLSMHTQGLDKRAKLFLAAHSPLSARPLQEYLTKNTTLAANTVGLMLFGSFLQRVYRHDYPVSTMTIGAELDGVCRLTRVMEEYYHRVRTAADFDHAVATFPVVVVRGMNHFQFASGEMPDFIRWKDLQPEVSYEAAHSTVAGLVSNYISVAIGNTTKLPSLKDAVTNTGTFLKPLIEAYQLEASYKLKPPCLEDPPSPTCQVGCPWTQSAMVTMAELDIGHINDSDSIHPASEIFPKIHHPSILSTCSAPSPSCVVKLSSVSENVYHDDFFDDGGVATSANEIRAKLKSRQSVMIAAGYGNVDFNKSDAGSRCKTLNQQAYQWALANSDPITLKRFQEYGVAMVMGEDKGCDENGGLWIYLPMDYKVSTNVTGGEILVLQSIELKTPVTYAIEMFAGMHYCKLLSPARAMEWIYVDGLRRYYSVSGQ